MTEEEALHCALRPNRTSVWLPLWLLRKVGARRGVPMTQEQFDNPDIQQILAARLAAEKNAKTPHD